MELSPGGASAHVDSLVVHPDHFRRGRGEALLGFVMRTGSAKAFTVETGAANAPAIALYEKLGFVVVGTYRTPVGIEKVRMATAGSRGSSE